MKQRGYAVLMSLLALLSIAGVWLARVTVQTTAYNATQTLALSNARIALISYAVNYIDHYGAQSAGVGHFPCPDTDAPGSAHADPWHRDGPNPPCAKNAIEHGWLPRHVTVEDGRYHFHSRSHQRLLYAVSGQFVNNPLGRIVNAKTKSEFSVGQYSDVIAVIATPPLDVDIANTDFWSNPEALVSQGGAYSLIRTRDVLVPAMQRVGGWLAGQLNQALAQRCASSDEITEEITDETTDDINEETTDESKDCDLTEHTLSHCVIAAKYVLLHWLNTQSVPIDCENHEHYLQSAFTLLEQVPTQRHWFIRNQWYDFVELLFDQRCLAPDESECQFAPLPVADNTAVLTVQLQPLPEIAQE